MTASCYTADITLNTTLPIGDIQLYMLNCSVKSLCSMMKNQVCEPLQTAFASIPMIGIKNCDLRCCEGDLCNNPSGSAAPDTTKIPNAATTPNAVTSLSTTTSPNAVTTQNTTTTMNATTTLNTATSPTVKSSVQITSVPPNAAIFGILGLITVTFMYVF